MVSSRNYDRRRPSSSTNDVEILYRNDLHAVLIVFNKIAGILATISVTSLFLLSASSFSSEADVNISDEYNGLNTTRQRDNAKYRAKVCQYVCKKKYRPNN